MKQITIYHDPKCKKSLTGLQYLLDKNIQPTINRYLENDLSREVLYEILQLSKLCLFELIHSQEKIYKELGVKNARLSKDSMIDTICRYLQLLAHPIVLYDNHAILVVPAEKLAELGL